MEEMYKNEMVYMLGFDEDKKKCCVRYFFIT